MPISFTFSSCRRRYREKVGNYTRDLKAMPYKKRYFRDSDSTPEDRLAKSARRNKNKNPSTFVICESCANAVTNQERYVSIIINWKISLITALIRMRKNQLQKARLLNGIYKNYEEYIISLKAMRRELFKCKFMQI
jgi:hypothetical protein